MADFKTALIPLLQDEGGWSNNPADSGGETYEGISRHNWGGWEGWALVDAAKKTTTNLKQLNSLLGENNRLQLLVSNFYQQHFWNFDLVESQAIANKLLSIEVNLGKGHAVAMLQEALAGLGSIVAVDGSLGPQTLAAVHNAKEADILAHLRAELSLFYHNLVTRNPDLTVFLRGWLRRAAE